MKKHIYLMHYILFIFILSACGDDEPSAELETVKASATAVQAANATAQTQLATIEWTLNEDVLTETKATAKAAMTAEAAAQIVALEARATAEAKIQREPILATASIACKPLPDLTTAKVNAGLASSLIGQGSAHIRGIEAPLSIQKRELLTPPSGSGGLLSAPILQTDNVYRIGVLQDISTLNFWAAQGPESNVWHDYMLPQRLSLYTLSQKRADFVPQVALDLPAQLTEEGDFWVIDIAIRNDIVWSDGQAFTAQDVAFTANTVLNLHLTTGNWAQWYDLDYLDHVEVLDDYTVKYVYHTRPGLARHEWGALQAPILAAHYWEPIVEQAMNALQAAGITSSEEDILAARQTAQNILFAHPAEDEPLAGTFIYQQWQPGEFLELTANPTFFRANTEVTLYTNGTYADSEGTVLYGIAEGDISLSYNLGPQVQTIRYIPYSSEAATILALQNGKIDFILNTSGLKRDLSHQLLRDSTVGIIENSANSFRYLGFNHRRRPMNDCAFRQAVAVLIDQEFIAQTVLQNTIIPLHTFVPPANEAWYKDDVLKLGQGLNHVQRLNLAIAILEQAGYRWTENKKPTWDPNGGGQVEPGGQLLMPDGLPVPPLQLFAPNDSYDPLRSTFSLWVASWLNEIGIPVETHLAGYSVLVLRVFVEQNFDLYIFGWSLGPFPDFLRDFFHSSQVRAGGTNAGGYTNSSFDAKADALLVCETQASCQAVAGELQDFLAVEVPYVILFTTPVIEVYRQDRLNYPYLEHLGGLQEAHKGGRVQGGVRIREP